MIEIVITDLELRVAQKMAQRCNLNLNSTENYKHGAGVDFDGNLEKQLIGQLGQLIGCKWKDGTILSYLQHRWVTNQNPKSPDVGSDVIGSNIDFKASLMRRSQDPETYNLGIKTKEKKPGMVYIQVLIGKEWDKAYLTGWATTEMFPCEPLTEGAWAGTYKIPVNQLNPLPPFKWNWFEGRQ
jgi:hypothetical protein